MVKRKNQKDLVPKDVYGLVHKCKHLQDLIEEISADMPLIKRHVFTANKQWDAHKRIRQNLPTDALLTVEDYQINNALEPWEQPIAVSYAANQKQFALYPVGVEYMKENALKKTAIIFLTEDLAHDHQQVRKFEARVFEARVM